MSFVRTDTVFPLAVGGTVAERPAESGVADIVARALAILDEETRAWVDQQRELAKQSEGGPDA